MYNTFFDIWLHNKIIVVGISLLYGHGYFMLTGVQVWNSVVISILYLLRHTSLHS